MKRKDLIADLEFGIAFLTIAGAVLMSFNASFSKWGWPLWVTANVMAIIFYAHHRFRKLVAQSLVLLATSLFGLWQAFAPGVPTLDLLSSVWIALRLG